MHFYTTINLYSSRSQTHTTVNIPFCFCSQPDDGYTSAETCSWFCMAVAVFRLNILFVCLPKPDSLKRVMAFGKSVKNNPEPLLWFTGITSVFFCGRKCSLGVTLGLPSDVWHILWMYSLVSVLVLNRSWTCEREGGGVGWGWYLYL